MACEGGKRYEVLTRFRWGNLREREHVQDLGVDGRIILKLIFKKWNIGMWTEYIWLKVGICGGLFSVR